MATESPQDIDRSNEAPVTTESEPAIKIDSGFQNVESDNAHVNGDAASTATDEVDNKAISDIIDDLVNSAEVSISGGSDNETSRSRKLKDDGSGHIRTSSAVKKPTSFKAVSVNKTFLAAKGATSSLLAKGADKPAVASALAPSSASTVSLGARPRLVAKSGSGLVAKSASGSNGGKGSAPDPNAVWNKNRPVPPPEPKKFTDEELKKYGIHMASRLQSDVGDSKGHANWADIDDDDEDYLETITWKDGTKITIPHVEDLPPTPAPPAPTPSPKPVPQQAPESIAQHIPVKEAAAAEKPKSPAPPPVRLLPSGKGLVLHKGAPEKPTLVAKPPAPPTPAKSPWAPIPKVENASPIIPELSGSQHQHGGPRYIGKDGSGPNAPPTKEIAVDDFHRGPWRDGPGAHNRELYNSHNGLYEPVHDRRGQSIRNEQHSRQQHPAALLQRAVVHETQGPAEPSSAFQTSRVSEQHVPYGRRRGSSNVSGGSGSLMRFKDNQPLAPPELLGVRRESFGAVSDRAASPVRNYSPSGQQHPGQRPYNNQPNWQQPQISPAPAHSILHHQPTQHQQPHPSAAVNSPVPSPNPVPSQLATAPVAPLVTEQDYALQKRLMQERRELAKQRRVEEEAREEAARKERIRLKLEAMGPAPERRSAKQAGGKDDGASVSQSQPQPPKDATGAQPPTAPAPPEEQKQGHLQASPLIEKASTSPGTLPNGLPPAQEQPAALPPTNHTEPRAPSQGHPHGHPHPSWPNSASQPQPQPQPEQSRYSSWTPRQLSNKNVWGSPTNDRSLGNGTFDPTLGRIPDAPLAGAANKHVPGPIAPPTTNQRGRAPLQGNTSSTTTARPAPIGPPNRQLSFQRPDATARNVSMNAWTAAVQENDTVMSKELQARREAQERELEAQGLKAEDVQAPIKETWRPTKLGDDGRRKNEKAQQVYHDTKAPGWAKPSPQPVSPIERQQAPGSYGQLPQAVIASVTASPSGSILGATATGLPQTTKSSRFFPNSRDVRQELPAVVEKQHRSSSPSPPPPDMAGHPAFDGDMARPQVHLPPARPRVCLPPTPAPAPAAEPNHPVFGWANPAPYKEAEAASTTAQAGTRTGQRTSAHDKANNWQTMFDNLLHDGPKHTTAHRPAVPVVSASRSSLEHPQYTQSATVSLPLVARGLFKNLAPDNDGSTISKDMAEDCFEEQEMGSVPPVRLPKLAPLLAWHPYPAPKPVPKRFSIAPSSIDMVTFYPETTSGGTVISLFVPGMTESKNMTLPWPRTRSNPRRPRGGRNTSQPHRGGKGRDTSSSYSNEHGSAPSPSGSNPRGRGGYRGGREYLPRHQGPAPIST